MRFTVGVSDRFWRVVYGHGMWIPGRSVRDICNDGWRMLDGFSTLAVMTARHGFKLCRVRPKIHMMCHLILQLQHQLPARMVLNLTSYMCWTDEDMIGRIARLSRRAHKKTTPMRTLERAKCLYVRQWARHFSSGV